MTLLLNVLWLILGGWISGLAWLLAGIILAITIVGLPWSLACMRIGMFSLMPFGKHIVSREALGQQDLGTGPLGLLMNIAWFVLGGWWLALHHVLIGVALCLMIIGIPFGIQHFKLALIALAPIGKEVVEG